MSFYLIVALTVLNHIAYKGSKMLVSLYAIDFGGTPFEVGILFSLYSIFSLFIAVHVGRWSDRVGPRRLRRRALGEALRIRVRRRRQKQAARHDFQERAAHVGHPHHSGPRKSGTDRRRPLWAHVVMIWLRCRSLNIVMPGLVPGIHVLLLCFVERRG